MEERRIEVIGAASQVRFYVLAVLGFALLAMALIAGVAYVLPNNQTMLTALIGFATMIITSLLGGGLYKMAVAVDGKLSHLLEAESERKRLEGKIEGLKENPKVNID